MRERIVMSSNERERELKKDKSNHERERELKKDESENEKCEVEKDKSRNDKGGKVEMIKMEMT